MNVTLILASLIVCELMHQSNQALLLIALLISFLTLLRD